MAVNVGINVIEVDGRASPTIAAAATSVAAFVGRTERGIPNRPVRVTDAQQFSDRFGGYLADGYLAYAVNGFFLNGGREAYINRVSGAGSAAAAVTLLNRATTAAAALRVSAGYRGTADPGGWGERLRVDVRNDPRLNLALQADTAANATSAQLASVEGLAVNRVVRFTNGGVEFSREITTLDAATRTIGWDAAQAIAPVLDVAGTQVTSDEFRLTVRYQVDPTADFVTVEDWRNLSMNAQAADYAVTRINEPNTGSRYILLSDVSGTATAATETPAVASNVALTSSSTPALTASDFIGSAAQHSGLFAFDVNQVQLIAVPDAHRLDSAGRAQVVRAALDYCAGRGDCMYVGSAPDRDTVSGGPARALSDYDQLESDYLSAVQQYAAGFQASKVFGALYAPWIQVSDPAGAGPAPALFVPPEGHVMGIYARTEQERGIFKAPAGNAAGVRGALAVSAAFTDVQHTTLVRDATVNGIRFSPGLGITVAASRTLSTDTRWWFVGTRLLFNFVKSSLRDGLRFVRQEPHSEDLRRMVRFNVVTPFLLGLWRQGAFGSDPPEAVFTVKCDAENNPPNEVDLGNFRIEVYFYPVKPAETILIVVGQQPTGATAAEA